MANNEDELDLENLENFFLGDAGLMPNNDHQPLAEGFDEGFDATFGGYIKTNQSPAGPYSTPYDEISPHSSGSSRTSFDSSLAPFTESPASFKSSLEGDIMADTEVSKPSWNDFQFMDTDARSPGYIDPSTISNAHLGQMDHDSPLDGMNMFAPVGDESSPAVIDKQSPNYNVFTFGGNFETFNSSQPMENLAIQNLNPHSPPSPFGQQKVVEFHGLSQVPGPAPGVGAGLWPRPPGLGNDMMLFHGGTSSGPPDRSQLGPGTSMSSPSNLYGPGPHKLEIMLDPKKRKSRVETQIHIKLVLSPLPVGIKRIHLPHISVCKPKLWAKPPARPSPDTLEVHASVVCTSAMQNPELLKAALARARHSAQTGNPIPFQELDQVERAKVGGKGGEVRICASCVTRENKRAQRKKKVKSQEEDALFVKDEWERVIIFNTNELGDWVKPNEEDVKKGVPSCYFPVPMRITCYCRHHNEKSGFQVIFTLTNHVGEFVAQSLSPVVMITDDHKTNTSSPESPAAELNTELTLPTQEMNGLFNAHSPFNGSNASLMDLQPQPQKSAPAQRNLSRSASPLGDVGPSSKRRKPSSHKIPTTLQMTPVGDVSPQPVARMSKRPSLDMRAVTPSGYPPSAMQFSPSQFSPSPGYPLQLGFPQPPTLPFANSPSHAPVNGTINGNPFPGLMNGTTHMYSAPASTHASRAPSPSGLRTSASPIAHPQPHHINQSSAMHHGALYSEVPIRTLHPHADPVIFKVIPREGPKSGAIDVAVVGTGFAPGMSIMFGLTEATITSISQQCTAVCILPPSHTAGTVSVTVKGQAPNPAVPTVTFTYNDEDKAKLMQLALSILNRGLNLGNEETIKLIEFAATLGSQSGNISGGPIFTGGTHTMNMANFESDILSVFRLIDLSEAPQEHYVHLDIQTPSGQSMLHLAASMGLLRVVDDLLARNANANLCDRGGYTPLHIATLNNRVDIVQRLLGNGADPTLRTVSGLTVREVARCQGVLDIIPVIPAIPIQARASLSRDGLLDRRVRSATSLSSAWVSLPPRQAAFIQAMPSYGQTTSGEEDEDSWDDSSSDDGEEVELSDEEQAGVEMMGLSRFAREAGSTSENRQPEEPAQTVEDIPERPPSPTATVAALKEHFAAQFQQIQQTMVLHFQSLPQFPFQNLPQFPFQNLPQFPNMPAPLTDYQQRLLAMVPTLGSSPRPDSPSGKATGKWWERGFMGAQLKGSESSEPPPYEELYPQDSSSADTKQASAAAAAAEAEADQKCATLYDTVDAAVNDGNNATDETKTESLDGSLSLTSDEEGESSAAGGYGGFLPEVLQIPRRSAITKEHRDTLRQAHAIKVTWLSSDWKLWCIWMPALVLIMAFMLYNSAFVSSWRGYGCAHPVDAARAVGKFVQNTMQEAVGGGNDGGEVTPGLAGLAQGG